MSAGHGRFHDAVALVSGGGRGIGRGIAEGLGREGARVGVAARSLDECEETARAIREAGGSAIGIPLDVTDEESCQRAVQPRLRDFRTPDAPRLRRRDLPGVDARGAA